MKVILVIEQIKRLEFLRQNTNIYRER